MSVKYRSSVVQVSVMYRSSIDHVSVEYRWFKTMSVETFIGRLSIAGRLSTDSRPIVGRQSTDISADVSADMSTEATYSTNDPVTLQFDLESPGHRRKNVAGNTAEPCLRLNRFLKMAEGESNACNDRKGSNLI